MGKEFSMRDVLCTVGAGIVIVLMIIGTLDLAFGGDRREFFKVPGDQYLQDLEDYYTNPYPRSPRYNRNRPEYNRGTCRPGNDWYIFFDNRGNMTIRDRTPDFEFEY